MIQPFEQRTERLQRRVRLALVVGIAMLLVWLAASFAGREMEIRQLRDELTRLDLEKAKILGELKDLQAQLDKRDDLKLLEYLARKELGMTKPGEEVYIIITEEEKEREP